MPTIYRVLGQVAPANTTNANLYTVPAATSAVVSTLSVTNTSSVNAVCRIFIRVGGAAAGPENAIIFNGTVPANDLIAITVGVTLAAGNIVTVHSGTAGALTFQAFGSEIN